MIRPLDMRGISLQTKCWTVRHSQSGKVVQYIPDQALHHQQADFKAEFREFLKHHEMDYDERYVWD